VQDSSPRFIERGALANGQTEPKVSSYLEPD
jgi:hypothetical protein